MFSTDAREEHAPELVTSGSDLTPASPNTAEAVRLSDGDGKICVQSIGTLHPTFLKKSLLRYMIDKAYKKYLYFLPN